MDQFAAAAHTNWQDLDPGEVQLATSQDWLAYWRELGGSHGDPPPRAALNLPAQRPALCKLALWVQLLEDGDYLFRLAGEEIRQRFGTRLAGLRLSELPLGADAHDIRRCYQTSAQARAPACARGFTTSARARKPAARRASCRSPATTDGSATSWPVSPTREPSFFCHRGYINMLKISENLGKPSRP